MSNKATFVRLFVDDILNKVPDDVSDEDYDEIETAFLDFRKIFTNNLHEPHSWKTPSWYVVVDGSIVLCEGYQEIPEFQGREAEVASLIEGAVNSK